MEKTIGQEAFEAYSLGFAAGPGPWEGVSAPRRAAWEAAANAVYQRAVEEFLTEEERRRMMAIAVIEAAQKAKDPVPEPSAPAPPPVCTVCHATARRARLSEDRWAARIKELEERVLRAEAVLRGEP